MAGTGRAHVTIVTARGCHHCEDAGQALAEFSRFYPLTVEEFAAYSPAGEAMALEYGTGIFPLVLVDGAFFSAGRLPRNKLARLLAQRYPATIGVG